MPNRHFVISPTFFVYWRVREARLKDLARELDRLWVQFVVTDLPIGLLKGCLQIRKGDRVDADALGGRNVKVKDAVFGASNIRLKHTNGCGITLSAFMVRMHPTHVTLPHTKPTTDRCHCSGQLRSLLIVAF